MATIAAESLIPETTLQRLAPATPGYWVVIGQASDHVTLAYVMNGGHTSFTYDIFTCSTEDEVINVCGDAVYEYDKSSLQCSMICFARVLTISLDVSLTSNPTYLRPLQNPASQPVQLALRPRATEVQVHQAARVNDSAGPTQTFMNQQNIAAILAHGQLQDVQGTAVGNTQSFGPQGMVEGSTGNGSVYLPNFAGIGNMADDQATWGPITADISMLGPDPSEFTPNTDMSFMGGDVDGQFDWSIFTN
ncbi:hypothetical protein O9K51_02530 [Purpureocillium lavendulum]|uniref:Uncharacterized protein n=1 Tax=Purpureocillium lavendulum TaxID=1247861 RepID=A0AB34FZG7_9HYPO|nr:hypothetical protein O9K51_02530 [Purpureocillium lavendulum]